MVTNVNSPNGFQFFGKMEGASPTVGYITRTIVSTDTAAIGFGDPVTSLGTGYVTLSTAGTTQIAGIFYGCKYLSSTTGQTVWSKSWPGSGAASNPLAYIDTDPNSLYQVQSNNTAIVFADIDGNINFVAGTPQAENLGGSATSAADQSTIATTNTLPFRIVGLLTDYQPANSVPGTDNTAAYNRIVVRMNLTDRTSLTGIV